jgi:hypothetical protein
MKVESDHDFHQNARAGEVSSETVVWNDSTGYIISFSALVEAVQQKCNIIFCSKNNCLARRFQKHKKYQD